MKVHLWPRILTDETRISKNPQMTQIRGGGGAQDEKSRNPVCITDHGRLVAVRAAPHLYRSVSRRRVLLPEYAALLEKIGANDVLEDLDAVRGNR